MLRKWNVIPRFSGRSDVRMASRGVASGSGQFSGHRQTRTAPPASVTSSNASPPPPPLLHDTPPMFSNPMEALTFVFKANPSALRLHRELTIALASGDAESAADLAGLLARKVKLALSVGSAESESDAHHHEPRSSPSRGAPAAEVEEGKKASRVPLPKPTVEDVDSAMDVVVAEMLQRGKGMQHAKLRDEGKASVMDAVPETVKVPAAKQDSQSPSDDLEGEAFWRSSDALRVTIIESSFETTSPEGSTNSQRGTDSAADAVADDVLGGIGESEERDLKILDEYLAKEATRWKAQKEAIAKVLVDTAKRIGLTPELVHTFDESTREGGNAGKPWSALKHYNIIVRGVVPSLSNFPLGSQESNGENSASVANEIRKELDELEKRMKERGVTLRAEEKEMALYELAMSKCSMHYVVGIHRELQLAMDAATTPSSKKKQQHHHHHGRMDVESKGTTSVPSGGGKTGSQQFMDLAMSSLHPEDPTQVKRTGLEVDIGKKEVDVAFVHTVTTPVLPFTFTIKLCMWYDVPASIDIPGPSVDS